MARRKSDATALAVHPDIGRRASSLGVILAQGGSHAVGESGICDGRGSRVQGQMRVEELTSMVPDWRP